jgi:hypothetical protein
LLAGRVYSEDLGLKHFDVTSLKILKLSHDVLGAALAHHHEEKSRHEDMIGAPIDQYDVMPCANGTTQLRRSDDTPTSASEDNDLFSPVSHAASPSCA